ncbi:MAG: TolC family protein, partial [Bacteroidota bacterium]|nr:TolC family protein [Bacteroidota bacterium]
MYNWNLKEQRKRRKTCKIILVILFFPSLIVAQQRDRDSVIQQATLTNCVHYAIAHNPELKNARLNEDITEAEIKIKLADWYPQVNFNYNFQHNLQLPTSNFNGNIISIGSKNTSGLQFGATQNIFNKDVLLASRSSKEVRLQSQQNTVEQNINIAAMVSKAFYDVLLTKQQINVTEQDIVRIDSSLKDAYYQYQSGIADKTDYKRATISLNNAKAQKKFYDESVNAKYAYLKQLMGYPPSQNFDLVYDTTQMPNEILLDTLQYVNYSNRIEIRLLETQKKLQQYNLQYYKWSFLPSVSAFGNYNLNFLNNQFSKLYGQNYPNSFAGIALGIPIFQGGKRVQQIKEATFQISQVDNSIINTQNNINTQYTQALATYKSNLYNYNSLKENLSLANEVYDVIQLQYKAGIKSYIEVINAESDLRTAQINFYNALYQL